MSTNVTAFTASNNPEYVKHAKVLQVCLDAGLSKLPPETAEYFGSEYVEAYLLEDRLRTKILVHEWSADSQEGFELYVKDIPAGVEKIRFYNSY